MEFAGLAAGIAVRFVMHIHDANAPWCIHPALGDVGDGQTLMCVRNVGSHGAAANPVRM